MRPVNEPVDLEHEVFGAEHLREQLRPSADCAALLLQPCNDLGAAITPRRGGREQHAAFLEGFPRSRDGEPDTLTPRERPVQIRKLSAAGLRRLGNSRQGFVGSVRLRHSAAGKHPHAAHERELLVAANHQHFDRRACLAQGHDRCGRTGSGALVGALGAAVLGAGHDAKLESMRLKFAATLALTGILLAAVVFAPVPGNTRWMMTLHDTAHAPVFGCLAILSLFLARSRERFRSTSIPRQYLAALGLTALLGVATEIAQLATGRDASFADIGRDVLGAAAFLVLYAAFDEQIRHAANARRVRSVGVLSAVLLLVILIAPLARAALAYRAREQRFPVLADFSRQFDPYFLGQNRAKVELEGMPQRWAASKDEATLRVQFAAEPYPGIEIAEPAPDWRAYATLALDLTNPTDAELRVVLWVSDARHDYEYVDRLNKVLRIAPQTRNVVRVPVAEVENAPATRRMDLSRIANIALFRAEPADGTEMYLSRVWLE